MKTFAHKVCSVINIDIEASKHLEENLEENKDLQGLNTLAVPARARYFYCATSIDQLCEAIAWAHSKHIKIKVLGEGSNVLLPAVVDGLVLCYSNNEIEVVEESGTDAYVRVGAGHSWHALVMKMLARGFFGLENLALIPGTVGAAPVQNIGAYGVELKDVFHSLQAINIETAELVDFSKAACCFGYRDSIFKQGAAGKFLINAVCLRLSTEARPVLTYPSLKNELSKSTSSSPNPHLSPYIQPSPRDVADAVIAIRRSKLPDPALIPNAGSFFKNPVVDAEHYARIKTIFPDVVAYDIPEGKKLAAACLIEKLGWKGRIWNGVQINPKQALVICNPQNLGLEKILACAKAIQKDVYAHFSVHLDIEPQIFSDDPSDS